MGLSKIQNLEHKYEATREGEKTQEEIQVGPLVGTNKNFGLCDKIVKEFASCVRDLACDDSIVFQCKVVVWKVFGVLEIRTNVEYWIKSFTLRI
jgi:hypothetical protein